jgi:exodeoxyribonuclease VII small subunit
VTDGPGTRLRAVTEGAAGVGAEVASMTYEQARDALADVVRRLESGGLPLEESMRLWEHGEQLADRCDALLDAAQHRLDESQATRAGAQPSDAATSSTTE